MQRAGPAGKGRCGARWRTEYSASCMTRGTDIRRGNPGTGRIRSDPIRRCDISTARQHQSGAKTGGPAGAQGKSGEPTPGTLGAIGEFALIAAVTKDQPQLADTSVGPGDDAAVVAASGGRGGVSVDMLVQGVHFRTDWASGEQIGRRAALA